jgi:hypothetical protein
MPLTVSMAATAACTVMRMPLNVHNERLACWATTTQPCTSLLTCILCRACCCSTWLYMGIVVDFLICLRLTR